MTIIDLIKQMFSATDEQINAFSEAMKTNSIFTTSHENMDVRYPKLKGEHETVTKQYGEAQKLIEEMKKATKDQEGLQGKITTYEGTIQQLQTQLQQEKINSAIKVGLLSEKALDVSYLTYKLKEKLAEDGETLTLDDNGNIKGWSDKLAGLKTQFPTFFEAASGADDDGYQVYDPNKLKKGDGGEQTVTKERFMAMGYEERLALKQKNENAYKQLVK